MASKDYCLAGRLAPSPIIDACRGYCLSRLKYHRNAIAAYHSALKAGYDRPALLYNNIGFSYLTLGQLNDAEKYLQRSIELDDNLQAAHYNMIMLYLQRAIQGQPIPRRHLSTQPEPLRSGLKRQTCIMSSPLSMRWRQNKIRRYSAGYRVRGKIC